MESTNNKVPVKEGLWSVLPDGDVKLVGSKCKACGEVFFPKKELNYCSYCQQEDLEDILLSKKGKITTYTVVYQKPAGGFYKGPIPYSYGMVELPDGVNVETLFTGCDDLEQIKSGLEANLVIEKLFDEEDGTEILTYKFAPIF